MTATATVGELAALVKGEVRGDGSVVVRGVADVAEAGPDELTFVTSPAYAKLLPASGAGAVLVPSGFASTPMTAILCERVDRAIAQVLEHFATPRSSPPRGIHATAVVDDTAQIGDGCAIGPHAVVGARTHVGMGCVLHAGAFIGERVSIGDDCLIGPNAVVADECELGCRVALHACAVIGGEGFGFYFDRGRHHRVVHTGTVILGDDVEVGSCSCVDRAKFGATRIGRGTKIDNLVQVAHNTRIGEHCVVAGQTGLSGSANIGDYCVFGGRSGATDGVKVAQRVVVGACALITKDIPSGMTVLGEPAQDIHVERRERAAKRRLPKLIEQVRRLVTRVERLEVSTDDQSRGGV